MLVGPPYVPSNVVVHVEVIEHAFIGADDPCIQAICAQNVILFMSTRKHHLWRGWGYVVLVIFFSVVFNVHTFFELTTTKVENHLSEDDNQEG